MKPFAAMLILLLIVGIVLAQEEELTPEIAPTNTVDEVTVTNATGVAVTNITDEAKTTNRIEQAEADLLGLRDPFWPVGYEPAPPELEVSEAEVEKAKIEKKIKWPVLHLKGITHAGKDRHMAIVAGIGLVEPDQTITLRRGDLLYSWLVEAVTPRGVKITRLEARPYNLPTIGVRTQ